MTCAMASFRRQCWPLVNLYLGVLTGKYKVKSTSLECAVDLCENQGDCLCERGGVKPFVKKKRKKKLDKL